MAVARADPGRANAHTVVSSAEACLGLGPAPHAMVASTSNSGPYLPHPGSDPYPPSELAEVEVGTRLVAMPATPSASRPDQPTRSVPPATTPTAAATTAPTNATAAAARDTAAERRGAFRRPVEVSCSIALMLLDGQGEPASPWMVADILDLSLGGLCLLTHDRYNHPYASTSTLLLDLSTQPSFGVTELAATLRWYVKTDPVVTLGVAFEQPLPALPMLQSRK